MLRNTAMIIHLLIRYSRDWQNWFCEMAHNYRSIYDKPMYACQISVSTHGPMGAVTLATPDGRLAGTTYSDGSVSAYAGTDKNGPYALFNSATCWNHSLSQNSQMNLKIHPSAVRGREGGKKFLEMIKAYMRKGGFHVQFNIVDSKMLRDAQSNSENYRGTDGKSCRLYTILGRVGKTDTG